MRAVVIVIHPTRFNDGLCIGKRGELVHVQTLVPQPPVKRLKEGIFDGFARSDEIELYVPPIGPIFQGPGLEFRPMIDRNRMWSRCVSEHTIQDLADDLPGHPKPRL